MDQIKTGQLIAEERKLRNLTQQQLADQLGISNKTISKWETGKGLPELSLLLPLCEALNLSVNELLSGERLSEENYREKAEENMMNMLNEKELNAHRMKLVFLLGIISTITFVVLIWLVCFYTDVMSLPVKIALVTIACGVFAVGMYATMQGERTVGYYKCKHCGETFVPTFWQYTWGMHILTTRYLECPHCHKKSWCRKQLTKEE